MADDLGEAFKKIGKLQGGELWAEGRRTQSTPAPRMIDLADAIEFCSRGIFKVEICADALALAEMDVSDLGSSDFETIPNRGQIHPGGQEMTKEEQDAVEKSVASEIAELRGNGKDITARNVRRIARKAVFGAEAIAGRKCDVDSSAHAYEHALILLERERGPV